MKNIKGVFRNLERLLSNAKWFGDDWHIYNRGEYLQLYKGSWHNDNQGGVHFETFIEAREIRQKAFPICVHAEEDCPPSKGSSKSSWPWRANGCKPGKATRL